MDQVSNAPVLAVPWDLFDAERSEGMPSTGRGALAERAAFLDDVANAVGDADLPERQRVALVQAAAETANRSVSIQLDALLGIFDAMVDDGVDEELAAKWTSAQVAAATGCSEYVTDLNLLAALTVREKLPRVRDAFARGIIDLMKVRAFAQAATNLTRSQAELLEEAVLPLAHCLPLSRLRSAVNEAAVTVAGRTAEETARWARDERSVVFRQLSDSMAQLVAYLPAERAIAAQNSLIHLAELAAAPDDARTADARRADVLVDAILNAALDGVPAAPFFAPATTSPDDATTSPDDATPSPDDATPSADRATPSADHDMPSPDDVGVPLAPGSTTAPARASNGSRRASGRSGRRRPLHAVITVPLATLQAASDEPAILEGHGALPAGIARELMADATWQCAVVDDQHGTLLALGRRTHTSAYSPGKPLVEHVVARDRTCRFPGCGRAAAGCEIDHLVPHPRGSTCSCNTGPLCVHHHRLKHESGWQVDRSEHPDHPPGSLTWISPTGDHHHWVPPALTPTPLYRSIVRRRQEAESRAALLAAHADDPPPF